jgi:hypothetical protein
MTDLEEEVIVKYILDLDARAFPPRLADVEAMANSLRATRNALPVGGRWASRFVARQPELKTRWNRLYDYQRAQCEDPKLIGDWFQLVENIIAKYGIQESDIYNFDETGFMMGKISTSMVVTSSERRARPKTMQQGNREWVTVIQAVNATGWAVPPFIVVAGRYHLSSWYEDDTIPNDWRVRPSPNGWTSNEIGIDFIRHFENHTKDRKSSVYRLLVLDGHESHVSGDFKLYCKEHNIITLCMPAHSSHILQPLDVACFGPLKRKYGQLVEKMMRRSLTHIAKEDFLPLFKDTFLEVFTSKNIQSGFRGSGLVPFNPEVVISKLDVRLQTPTPISSPQIEARPWVSKTPQNPIEAHSQSTFLKT